jgi:hypothetical protein
MELTNDQLTSAPRTPVKDLSAIRLKASVFFRRRTREASDDKSEREIMRENASFMSPSWPSKEWSSNSSFSRRRSQAARANEKSEGKASDEDFSKFSPDHTKTKPKRQVSLERL